MRPALTMMAVLAMCVPVRAQPREGDDVLLAEGTDEAVFANGVTAWITDPNDPACTAAEVAMTMLRELRARVERPLPPYRGPLRGDPEAAAITRWAEHALIDYLAVTHVDLRAIEQAVLAVHAHRCVVASLDALLVLGDAYAVVLDRLDHAPRLADQPSGHGPTDIDDPLRAVAEAAYARCHALAVEERAFSTAVHACLAGLDRLRPELAGAELGPYGAWSSHRGVAAPVAANR